MPEEENKGNPTSIFNANILGPYKQATLKQDHTTCLSTTPRRSGHMWAGLWEGIVSVGKQRIARAPRGLLALPAPAQGSPALPTAQGPMWALPQWCHCRAGLQLVSYKPGPHPGLGLPGETPMLPDHRELPFPAPWHYSSGYPLQLGHPLHLAGTVKAHTAWQLKPEASGCKARRGRVTGACRYQKLHCKHKYGNTMPKNNLNSTSHICD